MKTRRCCGRIWIDWAIDRKQQQTLIQQGRFERALQMDIDDIRSKFGSKYDEAIQQMLEYVEAIRDRWNPTNIEE